MTSCVGNRALGVEDETREGRNYRPRDVASGTTLYRNVYQAATGGARSRERGMSSREDLPAVEVQRGREKKNEKRKENRGIESVARSRTGLGIIFQKFYFAVAYGHEASINEAGISQPTSAPRGLSAGERPGNVTKHQREEEARAEGGIPRCHVLRTFQRTSWIPARNETRPDELFIERRKN